MDVSFDLLRTFLAVYRAGSVTRAAGLLGLSQPPINTLFLVWREGYLHPAARRVRARLLAAAVSWLPGEISSQRTAGSAFATVSPCAGDREVNTSGQPPRAAV